ncbi:MAG: hypothetical protein R3Y35_07485 [Clostridia bacterium]
MEISNEHPKKVIHTNEICDIKHKPKGLTRIMQILVRSILIILTFGSVVLGENLFLEINLMGLFVMLITYASTFAIGKKEKVAIPISISFYDTYFTVFKEKRPCNHKMSRQEYDKYYYKDVVSVVFSEVSCFVRIRATFHGVWTKYKLDGNLENIPMYDKTAEGLRAFYFDPNDTMLILKELQYFIPTKINKN